MKIRVSNQGIDKTEAQASVLLFFTDERPLKGFSGLADWRMNGSISRLIVSGVISGAKGESILIDPNGRIKSGKLLMLGLGESAKFRGDDLSNAAASLTTQLLKIGVKKFSVAPPPAEYSPFDAVQSSSKIIRSIVKTLKEAGIKGNNISVTLLTDDINYKEVSDDVKKIVKEMKNPTPPAENQAPLPLPAS